MTEHNINEAAPLALGALAAKGGKLAAVSKVAGGAGKVAGRAKGLLDAGSQSVDKTSGRINEEEYILQVFTNHLLEHGIADNYYNACVLMDVLSDDALLAIVEKESQAFEYFLTEETATLTKPSTTSSTSGAKNKIVQTGRNAARNTIKPSNLTSSPKPTPKPSGGTLNPVSAAAKVIGADIMKGRTAAAKETKPGELGSMDWVNKGKTKEQIRTKNYDQNQGAGLDMKQIKSFQPKPKPQKPTKPKIKPVKPGPEPVKEPKTEPKPQTDPAQDPSKSPTKTPTKTGQKTGQKTGEKTGQKTGENMNPKTDTGLGSKIGQAAAVGTGLGSLALRKLPKPKIDGLGDIGKTSGRVNVKPKQSEQKEELEVVCDFLLDRGFATTGVEAENIYEHMSNEWKEFILNS